MRRRPGIGGLQTVAAARVRTNFASPVGIHYPVAFSGNSYSHSLPYMLLRSHGYATYPIDSSKLETFDPSVPQTEGLSSRNECLFAIIATFLHCYCFSLNDIHAYSLSKRLWLAPRRFLTKPHRSLNVLSHMIFRH
ncbi:hypothetical protein LXL04_006549 [Taraxacum kok-saghyz]